MKTNFSFYNSLDLFVNNKQIIVYPDRDAAESYKGFSLQDLKTHITNLIEQDANFFTDMTYAITFIWNYESKKMLDFWKFNGNFVDDRSGPLADVRVYKDHKVTKDLGTASGNTLMVLGIEEQLRRRSEDLAAYLNGPAPKLPFGLQLDQHLFA